MTTCRDIAEHASDLVEGTLSIPDRMSFDEHLAGCASCQTYVRQLRATAVALGQLPTPAMPAALDAALLRSFDARQARAAAAHEATGALRWSLSVAVATMGLLLAILARHPSPSPTNWAIGALVLATAAGLALAHRLAPLLGAATVGVALLTSLASPGVATGVEGLGPHPLHCLASEAVALAGAVGLTWLVCRRGPAVLLRSRVPVALAAGALAGCASLQVTCEVHGFGAHVLLFHVGGVAAAVVAGLLAQGPRAATA